MQRGTLRQVERHLSTSAPVSIDGQKEPSAWLAGVPPYFVKDGLESFRAAQTIDSDVVMVSYPKCGTSWLHQVLFCLLRMDEDGKFPRELEGWIGSKGQVYPDGIPAKGLGGKAFSGATVEQMLKQDSPRLFTTHIRSGNLPPALTGVVDPTASGPAAASRADGGSGRLIVIARNPKDAIVSGYYFAEKLSKGPFPALKPIAEQGVEGAWGGWLKRQEAHEAGDGCACSALFCPRRAFSAPPSGFLFCSASSSPPSWLYPYGWFANRRRLFLVLQGLRRAMCERTYGGAQLLYFL